MSLQETKKEVEKLRNSSHDHANKITVNESRLFNLEERVTDLDSDMKNIDEKVQENTVSLARGEEVMVQLEKATYTMNKTVNTLHDTVLTIDHSMGLFGKFLKYGIFPITVFLLGETFWVFLTRSQ
jgi:chromosome segregation ATPase